MITFAVCDDEQFMLDQLSVLISDDMEKRQFSSYSVRQFKDGTSLLENSDHFDLIFLDIQMKQPDGMETARRLRQKGNQSLLIFVTVLKELVFDAFEVQAYDYLVKPLDVSRFKRTMDRAFAFLNQKEERHLVIQKGSSCQVIGLSELVYGEVWEEKFIFIKKMEGLPIIMRSWKTWKNRLTDGFSAVTEVIWLILTMCVDAVRGMFCCLRAVKFRFPGYVNGTLPRHFCVI